MGHVNDRRNGRSTVLYVCSPSVVVRRQGAPMSAAMVAFLQCGRVSEERIYSTSELLARLSCTAGAYGLYWLVHSIRQYYSTYYVQLRKNRVSLCERWAFLSAWVG